MMKKILSLIIIVLMLCSCSSGVVLEGDLPSLIEKVTEKCDFSTVVFTYNGDDYAKDTLMYMYGIESESVLDKISEFALSERTIMDATTLAIIRFDKGTSEEVIENVKNTLILTYIEPLISALKPYNPTEAEVAEGYQFKMYNKTLVLVIFPESSSVFDALEDK